MLEKRACVQHFDFVKALQTKTMGLNGREVVSTQVLWVYPRNWLKLGALNLILNKAGAGGVIRDSNERWFGGFSYGIGLCEAVAAEIWAIFKGL